MLYESSAELKGTNTGRMRDEKSGMEESWHFPLLILQEEKPNWELSTWQMQHTEHTHTAPPALHPPQSQLCRGSSHPTLLCALPAPALLRVHPSHFLGRSLKLLEIPTLPSCQNPSILDKSCKFSLQSLQEIVWILLCHSLIKSMRNFSFQISPFPPHSLSSLYPQKCLKCWQWELITRQGKCHKWLQPFSNQNTHQIAESAHYTSLSRL